MADATEKLKCLHTDLVDARNGCEEAVKDATDDEVIALFARQRDLHAKAIDEISAMLVRTGLAASEDGSFMGMVHRGVIGIRAAITGLRAGALQASIDGENRLVEKYAEALASPRLNPDDAAVLERQKGELQSAINAMKQAILS